MARNVHKRSAVAQSAFGLKAKILHKRRYAEKAQLKKTLKIHDERNVKAPSGPVDAQTARPTYLLDREEQKDAKALSTAIKQKRKDKAAKYAVPLPKVRGIAEQEVFKVMRTGKTGRKSWKRMITKATFVGESFTRKPVKLERFIRPMGLRYKKANVTHRTPEHPGDLLPILDKLLLFYSGSQSYFPITYHLCQEESTISYVHAAGRSYQGNRHRSQCIRARTCHDRREGCLGAISFIYTRIISSDS